MYKWVPTVLGLKDIVSAILFTDFPLANSKNISNSLLLKLSIGSFFPVTCFKAIDLAISSSRNVSPETTLLIASTNSLGALLFVKYPFAPAFKLY